ncbi:hypothetical protein JAF88_004802 [Citrobacter freundii]|uniref:hypothetical protein n=1 Tax=Klebsiella aerogenes TaxID=548 RepID=UPI000575D3FE|nr:hypothetical protein [Klebsiella aerogenes]EGT0627983.1 hypothetical protein [Citrobacter freundii]KHM32365.1 hypothetical protein KV34_13325 [Klebsiella aerogenes]
MASLIKNKMTATALAVCTVLGMGYSAMASAADSVDFTTTINVVSTNKCEATVAAGDTGSNWALKWTLGNAETTGTIDYTNAGLEPLQVKVSINDDGANNCHLNKMKIGADMHDAVSAATDSAAYKVATSNGFWRYMPVVAKADMYTSKDFTTAVTGTVTVKGADGADYEVQTASQHAGQSEVTPVTGWHWGSSDAVVLSNGYLDNGGYAPLTYNGTTTTPVTFTLGTPTQNVDSAVIGVSAIIAKDPEDNQGAKDVAAVTDTETVNMPFTINVTWL